MVSLEAVQASSRSIEPTVSPRISFSSNFLDEKNFISVTPSSEKGKEYEMDQEKAWNTDFEFLSSNSTSHTMLTADELFFEGKLLPFCQMQQSEKLNKMSLKTKGGEEQKEEDEEVINKQESRVSWFLDDDPSPRPPKCTVLWKELLRLKKQRASTLSPSASSSSSSSSSSVLVDMVPMNVSKEGSGKREKQVKRTKKGLERTRSASIRIRPVINMPICTQGKVSVLPPLFPLRKGRLQR